MMIGENRRPHPTIHIPPWDLTVTVNDYPHSPLTESFSPLYRYLPSNDSDSDESLLDSFRMYEFKVRRCVRGRSHDWTECPFAHPGEKARRRDPRKYRYSGTSCPEFRKGNCRRGDSCEFAHGVFECWLHPDRYRTQPCKDGTSCSRRICFFAHALQQLRTTVLITPDLGFRSNQLATSPPVSPTSESPPCSPSTGEVIGLMRKMQLSGGGSRRSGLGLQWPGISEFEEIPAMEVVESGKELRARMYARLSRENSLG